MNKEPARNLDGSLRKYKTMDLSHVFKAVIDHPGNNGGYLSTIVGLSRESTRIRLVKLRDNDLIAQLGEGKWTVFYETNEYLSRKEELDKKHARGSAESQRRCLMIPRDAVIIDDNCFTGMNLLDQLMPRPI